MKPLEFVEIQTEDLEGGKAFFAELDAFWRAQREAPAVDITPHYDKPGDRVPDRLSMDRLIKRVDEFMAITGPKAPPGFAEAVAEHVWAAEHNLLTLWAYSNFWFALTDTGVTRSSVFGNRVNRWPIAVEIALHLLLDVRASLKQRWGLALDTSLVVEMPGNPPHVPPVAFTCPGPLHPTARGIRAAIHPAGPLVVTGEEWTAMEWARKALKAGLDWNPPGEKGTGEASGNVRVEQSKLDPSKLDLYQSDRRPLIRGVKVEKRLTGEQGQPGDRVLVDPDQPGRLADAAALGQVLQDREDLVVGQFGVEQRRALELGEPGPADPAVEQPVPGLAEVVDDQEVVPAPLAVGVAVGVLAAEAAEVVRGHESS